MWSPGPYWHPEVQTTERPVVKACDQLSNRQPLKYSRNVSWFVPNVSVDVKFTLWTHRPTESGWKRWKTEREKMGKCEDILMFACVQRVLRVPKWSRLLTSLGYWMEFRVLFGVNEMFENAHFKHEFHMYMNIFKKVGGSIFQNSKRAADLHRSESHACFWASELPLAHFQFPTHATNESRF